MVEQFFGAPLRRSQKTAPFEFPVAAAYSAGAALRLNDVVKNCSETVSNLAVSRAAPEPQIWPLDGCKCSAPAPYVWSEKTALGRAWRALQRGYVPALGHQPRTAPPAWFIAVLVTEPEPLATGRQHARTAAHSISAQRPGRCGSAATAAIKKCRGWPGIVWGWPGMARDGQGWSGMVWPRDHPIYCRIRRRCDRHAMAAARSALIGPAIEGWISARSKKSAQVVADRDAYSRRSD